MHCGRIWVSEEDARSRNLRTMIIKKLAQQARNLDESYDIFEITELFCFCKRDIKYRLRDFFKKKSKKYVLNIKTRGFIESALNAHKIALPLLCEAEIVFLKTFGRFSDRFREDYSFFDHNYFRHIYKKLQNVILVLHWGRLPILNKYLMINSSKIPENNVVDFYNHYDMLNAMLKDIRGEGENMTRKGDETLDHEMIFSVYTRRWGYSNNYAVHRTIDGWDVRYIAINGECDKDGTNMLFTNLDQDCVFYPKDGVKHAMTELWKQADEGVLSLQELQEKLQQIADWISCVERAVGEGQPDWVNYY